MEVEFAVVWLFAVEVWFAVLDETAVHFHIKRRLSSILRD